MINFAIWKDAVYETTATTLTYYVTVDGEVVFRGRAKAGPDGKVRVNLRRIAQDWMWNRLRDFLPLQGELVAHPEALRTFDIHDAETDAVLEQFTVLFDFADEWNGGTVQMNDPVNGHADPRQKIFIGNGSPTDNEQDIDDDPVKGDFFRIDSVPEVPFMGGTYCIEYTTSYRDSDLNVVYPEGLQLISHAFGYTCFRFPQNNTESGVTWTVCYEKDGETLECVDILQGAYSMEDDYLTIVPQGSDRVIAVYPRSATDKIYYKYGPYDWQEGTGAEIDIRPGGYGEVKFKAENTYCDFAVYSESPRQDVPFNAYGNVLSLVYGDDYIGKTGFPVRNLKICGFQNTGIVSAEHLNIPLTEIGYDSVYGHGVCYRMFNECTSLTTAPALRAERIVDGGCVEMYRGCSSLVNVPDIEATEYGDNACDGMFGGCESLQYAPEINATVAGTYAFYQMYSGCTALVEASVLPNPIRVTGERAFEWMYYGCTGLTTAHQITLETKPMSANNTFSMMYEGCWNLQSGVSFNLQNICENDFANAFDCYNNLWGHSSKVSSITVRATGFTTEYASDTFFDKWLRNCRASGTLYLTQAVSDKMPVNTEDGVPSGWTVQVIQ